MYIPSLFIYDHYFDGKLVDAHNTYDWLLKMSYFFKKNNCNFKVKLHPEKKIPDKFLKFYKKNISEKNLAKSIEDSYLIITDQPSSSSFAASIVSEKPIIFIDLKVQDFSNYAWKLLNKRCSIIKGSITNQGINLDWELLRKFIENPKKNFTKDFQNTYFENTI